MFKKALTAIGSFFRKGEDYTSIGIYGPGGYIEKDNNNAINAGVSLNLSTPKIGPYAETGAYVEHTWEPDGSQSNGSGTYIEEGMFYGGNFGAYISKGKCWDARNSSSNNKFSPPKLPKINYNRRNLDEIARKVYRGEYGNGDKRRRRLENEGYNYREVQNYINKKYY